MVTNKDGRPPGEPGVTRSTECDTFPFSALTLLVGWQKRIWTVKSWMLVCWWWRFDWSFASPSCLAPVKSRMETFWYHLVQVSWKMGVKWVVIVVHLLGPPGGDSLGPQVAVNIWINQRQIFTSLEYSWFLCISAPALKILVTKCVSTMSCLTWRGFWTVDRVNECFKLNVIIVVIDTGLILG